MPKNNKKQKSTPQKSGSENRPLKNKSVQDPFISPPHNKPADSVLEMMQMQYSGPIPPPNILSAYNAITPGFADRIMKMAEMETGHRHEMEKNNWMPMLSLTINLFLM